METLVTVNVGGRTFTTSEATLSSSSSYFKSRLSGPWRAEGPIFVDADPDVFDHVLAFMRTGVCPLFWSRARGFDLGLYAQVLWQARYFGVDELARWIEGERYCKAVIVIVRDEYEEDVGQATKQYDGNVEVRSRTAWVEKDVYHCPRGIPVHTSRIRCGKACEKAVDEHTILYQKQTFPTKHTTVTTTRLYHEVLVPEPHVQLPSEVDGHPTPRI